MHLQYRVLKLYEINPGHGNLKINHLSNRQLLEFELGSVNIYPQKYLFSLLLFVTGKK